MRYALLALALLAAPAGAQINAALPVTCNASGANCVSATPVTNSDGTLVGSAARRGTGSLVTSQISVGTTATLVVAARAMRGRLVITQAAAGPCYYGPSATVSATTGARLVAAGGSKTYQYTGALYGICPGGAVTTDVDEEF